MKKLNIFMSALLGIAFTACTENYDPEVGPQTYIQESPLAASDVTMSSAASAINIENLIESGEAVTIGTVSVREEAMPANTVIKAKVDFSRDNDFSTFITLDGSVDEGNVVTVSPSDLQDAYFNNITRNPKTVDLYMRTTIMTVTNGADEAIVGKPGENYYAVQTVPFTPLFKVQISPAYYVIGAAGGWSPDGARTQKFEHSDADVYDDPIFTITIDSGGDDCWFAIGDDAALSAIDAGDWTQLFGTKGESEDLTGNMDYRYNLGGDHSFHVQNAKKIRITLDMMEYSYTIEPVNIAENYYLIGGPGDWSADAAMTMPFSHSNKDVFEDPVFTYTFAGNGGEMWFAFGDKEAIDAVAEGTWNKLFGTKGESQDLSGSFDRRYNLDGDHSFCVDGKAKYYRVTINMAEMTYDITALSFDPYVYFIGATDGWTNAEQKLALTSEEGIYTGYIYCADPNGWGNEFKFQKVPGDWGTEINTGHMTGGITGDAGDGGGNFKVTAGEGVYYFTLDLANNTFNAVKVQNMNLVGSFNGWNPGDDAQQMTWDAENYCFVITGAGVDADGWKFTINNAWDINLGGTIDNLVANGDNLGVVGTTIKLYPTRKGADKIYCTVE
ncbi:MAG: DUF5115 domain-containing protein [Prevotella sp.]|nr:DUF5115 domain-containing protein [Prevotella sp.]